jgi:hypothetical protein
MRLSRILLLGAAAASLAACSDDETTAPELGPVSGLRYVNALPDSMGQDLRLIDVTWHAMLGIGFRAAYPNQGYMAVPAGQHEVKVFLSPTTVGLPRDPDVVKLTYSEGDITLAEGTNYTAITLGEARSGTDEFRLIADDYSGAMPSDAQLSFRVMHAAAGAGAVDIYVTAASADPLPAQPVFSNVAFGGVTSYTVRDTASMFVTVMPAGDTDPANKIATLSVPNGAPADQVSSGAAGDLSGGSVFTLFVMPGAVAGSLPATENAAGACTNCTPSILFATDRRPPILP